MPTMINYDPVFNRTNFRSERGEWLGRSPPRPDRDGPEGRQRRLAPGHITLLPGVTGTLVLDGKGHPLDNQRTKF